MSEIEQDHVQHAPAPAPIPSPQVGVGSARAEAAAERPRRRRRKRGGATAKRESQRKAQYWMIVTSPENLRRTTEHGFSLQGWKFQHRRRVESMRPGDRLLYYVTGRMAFAATATVTSPMYEDHTPIWRTARRDEDYPWRLHIRADTQASEAAWVIAKELAFRLDYVRKWPPEHWTLAFQGQLHLLPKTDFLLVEAELCRARGLVPSGA